MKRLALVLTVAVFASTAEAWPTKPPKPPTPVAAPTKGGTVLFAPNAAIPEIENDIVKKLDKAKTSIDVAMFIFGSSILSDGLIAAHKRGVRVRVLLDSQQTKSKFSKDIALANAGIDVKLVQTSGGLLGNKFHHKFCVIDEKVLITGSYNWTESADRDNYENCVTLTDAKLVAPFAKEFQSIWVSGKGGASSTNEVVFSPSGSAYALNNRIAGEIARADKEIVVAVYMFTSKSIAKALVDALKRGVAVSIISDGNMADANKTTLDMLKAAGAKSKTVKLKGTGFDTPEFHDKYCVIDGKLVITGSFNWNVNQDVKGFENVLVLASSKLAQSYLENFSEIWSSKHAH